MDRLVEINIIVRGWGDYDFYFNYSDKTLFIPDVVRESYKPWSPPPKRTVLIEPWFPSSDENKK
jgi:hypothetical protein